MNETIAKFTTPEQCEQYALNVEERGKPELAKEARRRAVELQAAAYGATSRVELEALEAVYAYQKAQTRLKGKKFYAARTWPMIRERGVIAAVERIVTREEPAEGYRVLVDMGMADKAFEAVVLRHPEAFSAEAVVASQKRLEQLKQES